MSDDLPSEKFPIPFAVCDGMENHLYVNISVFDVTLHSANFTFMCRQCGDTLFLTMTPAVLNVQPTRI